METTGKMDCNNLNYLQRLTPKVYPPPSASTLPPTSSSTTGGCTKPGPSPHLIQQQQQQQQNHRLHQHHPYPPQQQPQQDHSIYYSHQQSRQQHPQQLYHGASPHLTPSIGTNFQNCSSIQLHGHQGNLIGHSQGLQQQQQPKVTTSKGQPQTASVPLTNASSSHQTGPGIGSSGLTSSSDMELESMIVLFVEKRKELNQSLAKVEALSRQLEELKSGINGTTANYNNRINPINRVTGDKFDDLDKLRQELTNQTRLTDQQNVTLMHKQNLLMQRKCEIAGIDERISELQKRLAMKRMLNQQLSSQMKSRTGVAYGLPNDNSLNSGNPRLRSSVGPCNTIRLNNNYNRNNVTNTNVAAVEPFQRSTVGTNNYPSHSYDKTDENVDPMLDEMPPSKQHFQNLTYRNKFSPVELNPSNVYPTSVNINNTENTTNINNLTNCIHNSHKNHNYHHHLHQQQQQPFHLPISHHHQLQQQQQQQQMQLQRQHQQQHQQQQQYVSVGNSHKNGKNMNMSLASEMIMNSHTETNERCDENGTCEIVRPQSDGIVGGGENTHINSPLKHKIHLRERPSPSGSSSSSSDQLPAGYSPSKKILDGANIDNGVNNGNKSLNSVNHSSSNDYYGSRGGGTNDGENVNESMIGMGNCDYYNNPNNYRCSEPITGYDDTTTSPNEHHQLIDCIRKNSRMVNHHHHQQQLQQKQQSDLIEKCVSDLPNTNNNGNNNQNCSSLDEDDRSSLSGPSVTFSSGSNSSNHHHHHHQQQQQQQQESTILYNDDDNSSQLKGIQHNLRKSSSTSAVPTSNRLTSSNCGSVYHQQSTNCIHNNKDTGTENHHVPIDQKSQQYHHNYHHQYHHQQQQSNSFMRNGFASNNQESQIPSSFYDYSPSSSSSNNIYSCSIDVSSRSLTNDANSSLSSSITTTISSASSSISSSVPQSHNHHHHQQQHLTSSNLSSSPSSFKNGYHHPSSLRESNSQKLHPNKISVDEVTISSSSERLPPTVKEGNTGSNNSFQSMNQVNNKHQHHNQQQHLQNLHHRYQIQHRDDEDEEGNIYEEDADDTNHVSVNDNCKTIESRSSKSTTITSSLKTINQNNKNSINSVESSSTYSKGDEMITNDATNKETSSAINNKRRPVIADNKIEKELDKSGTIKSFERKPLNFQWPPPQYQSIDHNHHQKSKSITNKPDEGKKVTWAKKRILSKTTDDLRSPTKDTFCLKEIPSIRSSSILVNGNRTQKQDIDKNNDDDNEDDHHYKLSIDNKNNLINSYNNVNHCNKIKSSLKKDGNGHRVQHKKDHEGLTRRVSFDPLALLLDAALEGELDLVKKTSKIQDVSAANDEGITALHNTICAGHFEIVKYLVEIGCDVNAPDSDGWTPLHCAASCNNLTMVKYLVEHGACVFATTFPDKETAAQKCEEGEEGFDRCSQYLLHIQESLGIMNDGIVYAVYDYDAQSSDELSFKDGDAINILRRGDEDEKDWWWARLNDKEGYVPRNLLGLYPRVKSNKKDKVDAMD